VTRWLTWLAALAAVALLVLAGAALRGRRAVARVALTSGSTVSVLGATYGTNHLTPDRYPLERRLPAPLRRGIERLARLGPPPADHQTTEPVLLLWLAIRPGLATNPPPSLWLYAMLEDAVGQPGGAQSSFPIFPASVPAVQTVEFKVFPRRGSECSLVLLQEVPGAINAGARVLVGRLPVGLPARRVAPAWPMPAKPVVQSAGGVEGTLEGFLNGVGNRPSDPSLPGGATRIELERAPTNTSLSAAIGLRLRSTDGSTNRWTVGELFTADAGGNALKSSSSSCGRVGEREGRLCFRWEPGLWPGEPWEIRLTAKREADAVFAPEELVQFRNVPLPAVGATNHWGMESDAGVERGLTLPPALLDRLGFGAGQSARLRLEALERRPPITGASWASRNVTRLRLQATGWTNGLYLDLVRATDERGREVSCGSSGFSGTAGGAEFSFMFRALPADAQELNLVFAIHRGVPLTFRVDPGRAITNAWFSVKP